VSKHNNKKQNTFQVYGYNNCLSLLKEADYKIISIQILEEKKSVFSQKIDFQKYSKLIHFLSKKDFYKKFDNIRSQGIVICFEGPIIRKFDNYKLENQNSCLLILDQIEDPQNAGQIIRTAECAGIDAILIPEQGSAAVNADAVKTSAGALMKIPICRTWNMKMSIQFLKDSGLKIIACTDKTNKGIYEIDFKAPTAIIVGSEEDGISAEYLKICDDKGKIPINGTITSLNVSVASGIVLYEVLRQRN